MDVQPTRLAYDTVDGLVSLAMEHWMHWIIWTRKDLVGFDVVRSELRYCPSWTDPTMRCNDMSSVSL